MTDLWLIDAFTDRPFKGNPAGVCWLEHAVPDDWMQSLAMEMNQAETAFLRVEGDGFRLRWFTPAAEVDLCGHATLASSHYLWSAGHLAPGATARFQTRSGLLTATRSPDGWITLDFPAKPIRGRASADQVHDLKTALDVEFESAWNNEFMAYCRRNLLGVVRPRLSAFALMRNR